MNSVVLNHRVERLRARIDELLDERERWRDLAKKRGKRIKQLRDRSYELEDSRNLWRLRALRGARASAPAWLRHCHECGAYVPNLPDHRLDSHS